MKKIVKNDPRFYPTNLFGAERRDYAWAYSKTIEDMQGLHPDLQAGGRYHVPCAASWATGQALRRVDYEYLLQHPPCFLEEPYEVRSCLSYCNVHLHRSTLYRAANFRLVRTNERGIQTYARSLRRLSHAEHAEIARRSATDPRARRLRAARTVSLASLFAEVI
jgi:hypothetical protein